MSSSDRSTLKALAEAATPVCCNRPVPDSQGEPTCCGQSDYPMMVDAGQVLTLLADLARVEAERDMIEAKYHQLAEDVLQYGVTRPAARLRREESR